MKIVDKGWAVWHGKDMRLVVGIRKTEDLAAWAAECQLGDGWERRGFLVLPTTATATVAKKKARKK